MTNAELQSLFGGIAKGSAATCVAALLALLVLSAIAKAAR